MTTRYDLGTSKAAIKWWMEGSHAAGWTIRSQSEVDPALDRNKAMATHNDGYTPDRSFRRAAHIPHALQQYWLTVEGWDCFNSDHHDRLVKVLNDPQWAWLRTAPGRIGYSNGVMR